MLKRMLPPALSLLFVLFLVFQPIFPLIVELREYTQTGESLTQIWEFVSLPDFYAAAQFAKDGWLETTWRNYLILAGVNYGGLLGVFVVVSNVLRGLLNKNR